ncbi:hypothetical protein HELRODRAFT_176339 [Helobdella robusta]|uniref:Cystatin domain-containing protein n=1 Tax=Helobdella robusta TaxID=6412 RepID=T1FAE6_HELRO|nr:hypothetical protein HELRODRAFT_176339 [Helobdella robusta]ESO00032.1 hypothetical protein HELRODRAFT_176339 [Helobdella robusta]
MKFAICLLVLVGCAVSYGTMGMVGGWSRADHESEHIKKVAEKILLLFDDLNTSGLAQRLHSVKSAETQVVSGMNYKIKMDVGLLDCTEAQAVTNANCKITKVGECKFVYYEQSWTGTEEITSHECGEFVAV